MDVIRDLAGVHRRPGWGEWIVAAFALPEVCALAVNMRSVPELVQKLARLPDVPTATITAVTGRPPPAALPPENPVPVQRRFFGARKRLPPEPLSGPVPDRFTAYVVERAEKALREIASGVLTYEQLRQQYPERADALVRDLLAELGDTTVPIDEAGVLLDAMSRLGASIDEYLFGCTPMCAALEIARQRFAREQLRGRSTLVVVSDGVPTDGNPRKLFRRLRAEGVTVVSCYITDKDVQAPRALPAEPDPGWDDAARLMFEGASPVDPGSPIIRNLIRRGWTIPAGARLFAQANHSTVLAELLSAPLG